MTSAAKAGLVSVRPQAIPGAAAATCSAAAEATLDSPVLQEILTLMPKPSHSRQASITAPKPPSLMALRLTPPTPALVMPLDVVARMDAFVGADRYRRRGGEPRHGIERMRLDRLFEKIEAATVHQPEVIQGGLGGETLIGVSRHQTIFVQPFQRRAYQRGARRIGFRRARDRP